MSGSRRNSSSSSGRVNMKPILIGSLVFFAVFIAYQSFNGDGAASGVRGGTTFPNAATSKREDADTLGLSRTTCPPCPNNPCPSLPSGKLALGCPRPPPCPSASGGGDARCPECPQTECPVCAECPVCDTVSNAGGDSGGDDDDDVEYPVVEKSPDLSYVDEDFEPRDPLNIIYLHSPFHWPWHLDHWLRGLSRPVRMYIDPKGTRCMFNSIVVVNHLAVKDRKLDPNKYFRTCAESGIKNIGVFHTGDLTMDQSYDYYHKAAFVYRNHFPSKEQIQRLHLPEKKIRLLPLGSITMDSISLDNFYQTLPSMRRSYLCGFVGALKHSKSREAMAKGLRSAGFIPNTDTYKRMGFEGGKKCAVYFSTSRWKDKDQMKPHEYRALLSNAVFAPVPLGRGPDSFRLYEALELGAIPIITDVDHFNLPLGKDHPLPRVKKGRWDKDLVPILTKYHDDRAATFELQKRVFRWWVKWKYDFRAQMAKDVEGLF